MCGVAQFVSRIPGVCQNHDDASRSGPEDPGLSLRDLPVNLEPGDCGAQLLKFWCPSEGLQKQFRDLA